jgi:hypothetical protein
MFMICNHQNQLHSLHQYVVKMLTSSFSMKQIPKLEVIFRCMFEDFENYIAMNP